MFKLTIRKGYYHLSPGQVTSSLTCFNVVTDTTTSPKDSTVFSSFLQLYSLIGAVIERDGPLLRNISALRRDYRHGLKQAFADLLSYDDPDKVAMGQFTFRFDYTQYFRTDSKDKFVGGPTTGHKPSQLVPDPLGQYGSHPNRVVLPPSITKVKRLKRKNRRNRRRFDKRPGHPMVAYSRDTSGDQVITTIVNDKATVVVQRQTALNESLGNVSSVVGDHKKPNPQQFRHTLDGKYFGRTQSFQHGSGYNGQIVTGVVSVSAFNRPSIGTFPNGTVYNRALERLYTKLRGDIDLSIDLAETHKTRKMMTDTLRSMLHLWETFHKMRRSNPRDWGNLWLEYTYGWKPTVQTIYQTAQKLLAGTTKQRKFYLVETASEKTDEVHTKTEVSTGIFESKDGFCKSRARFAVSYALTGSRLEELAGFTSLNPVSIAWELTPYSFVVDWFFDFGGYLRNYESALVYGCSFVDGYVTESRRAEYRGTRAGTNFGPLGDWNSEFSQAFRVDNEKLRTVLTVSPRPRVPRFDPHLGSSRLISAASLLGQQLHSLKHPQEAVGDVWSPSKKKLFNWNSILHK